MTEPIVECIRECTRPCKCDQCTASTNGDPIHPPVPVEADQGLLCTSCAARLWAALHSIGDLYASLDWSMVQSGPSEGGGGSKVLGSPAPFRLDVFALQDPRSAYDPADPRGPLYVPNVVGKWDAVAARSTGSATFAADLNSALWSLVNLWDKIVQFVWVGQMHDELVHILGLLKGAHDLNPPRRIRIGRCPAQLSSTEYLASKVHHDTPVECGAALYAGTGPVTCSSCGRVYAGLDLVRLYAKAQKENAA